MTAELSPAHEARLEAFKALLGKLYMAPADSIAANRNRPAVEFVTKLLGELAAAQATNSVLKLSRDELWKGLAKAADDIAFGLGERTKLETRAEDAEQEVARLKASLAIADDALGEHMNDLTAHNHQLYGPTKNRGKRHAD